MQKKFLIGIVALIIIVGGGYAIFHKSTKNTNANSSTTTSTPNNQSQTAASGDIVQTKSASSVGQYLADFSGNALYTYGGDSNGVSNCSGSCLYSWPVYAPANSSASLPTNVTIITRSDGTKQYAYKGMPLYTFSGDSAGQVTGNNVSNFHIAKP